MEIDEENSSKFEENSEEMEENSCKIKESTEEILENVTKIDGNSTEIDGNSTEIDGNSTEITSKREIVDFEKSPKLISSVNYGKYFTKGCKWSPDGLCILVCSDDHKLKIFDFAALKNSEILPAVDVREGESVYDYQWYPLMNSNSPETCCFATTSQFQPIHLYDAFDGHIRATYRCFDHLDEMVASKSLCFNPQGTKLIAGLKNQIRIFDVSVPGRDCETVKTFDKKEGGLSGIISSIDFNPSMEQVFALASYDKSSAVYLDPRAQLLCVLEGQKGGITQIKFSQDGTKLICGARKDNEILVWDMRNPGELYATFQRKVETNQRIYFDVKNDFLISGSTDGSVSVWNLGQGNLVAEYDSMHLDAVNGISFHPYSDFLATSSGQRHIKKPSFSDDEESDDESIENTLKIWSWK